MVKPGQHTTVIVDGAETGGQIKRLDTKGRRVVGVFIAVGRSVVWRWVRRGKVVKDS